MSILKYVMGSGAVNVFTGAWRAVVTVSVVFIGAKLLADIPGIPENGCSHTCLIKITQKIRFHNLNVVLAKNIPPRPICCVAISACVRAFFYTFYSLY